MDWTIATWNVNSLKVRMPVLLDFLARHRPDAVALQETKLADDQFPTLELAAAGYQVVYAGQKTYNGVAILAKDRPDACAYGLPDFADEQKRVIAATVNGVRVIDLYVPNGQSVGSEKYAYKLTWLAALERWLGEQLLEHEKIVVLGDFNIAPQDEDVFDPWEWEGRVLFSEPEKAAFARLLALGFVDGFRQFPHPPKTFTWWDYRLNGFKRNRGLRIDHVLVSPALVPKLKGAMVDVAPRTLDKPSDHAPVLLTIDL
jgi:exodeoxyribonuclease-3